MLSGVRQALQTPSGIAGRRAFHQVLYMSLFDFFFGRRPARDGSGARRGADERVEPGAVGLPPGRPAPPASPENAEERRLRRHARREQLYVAIRESMTRSGVLAATYKFKVLSLDQPGNEFLVMVDLSMDFAGITGQLGAMETLIIQNAKARFAITVPTVYWRMDTTPALARAKPAPAKETPNPAVNPAVQSPRVEMPSDPSARPIRPVLRRDPLEADEVAAFRQALLAASARAPSSASATETRPRRKASSYTLLTGFEDTELPESGATPALSKTQYGDLQ